MGVLGGSSVRAWDRKAAVGCSPPASSVFSGPLPPLRTARRLAAAGLAASLSPDWLTGCGGGLAIRRRRTRTGACRCGAGTSPTHTAPPHFARILSKRRIDFRLRGCRDAGAQRQGSRRRLATPRTDLWHGLWVSKHSAKPAGPFAGPVPINSHHHPHSTLYTLHHCYCFTFLSSFWRSSGRYTLTHDKSFDTVFAVRLLLSSDSFFVTAAQGFRGVSHLGRLDPFPSRRFSLFSTSPTRASLISRSCCHLCTA